jgi:Flp pilus assembly protein TadD
MSPLVNKPQLITTKSLIESADLDTSKLGKTENNVSDSSQDSELENLKGLNLAKKGEFFKALVSFQMAVELNPNNARAWYNFGTCLTKVDEYNERTLHCFEKAIEINQLDAESWNNKGTILAGLGRNKEAMICYQRATEIMPGHAKAWQNMGILCEKQGNKKAAKEYFKKAIESGLKC